MLSQEALDIASEAVGLDSDGHNTARGRRIKNLADPVTGQDAVTKNHLEGAISAIVLGGVEVVGVSLAALGADITGVLDATEIIKGALNYTRVIKIPTGATVLIKELDIPEDRMIIGEGETSVLKIKGGTSKYGLKIGSKVRLHNFTINGNASNVTDRNCDGIWANGFRGADIDRVFITNCKRNGVLLVGSTDDGYYTQSRVRNCHISFCGQNGIQYNTCKNLSLTDNVLAGNGGSGITDFVYHVVEYTGDGVTKIFAYPFHIKAATELRVVEQDTSTYVETVRILDNQYVVTGVDNDQGGTVGFVNAPPVGYNLRIQYRPPASGIVNGRTILSMAAFQSSNITIDRNFLWSNAGASIYLQNRPDWDLGQTYPNPLMGYEQQMNQPFTMTASIVDNKIVNASIGMIARGWHLTIGGNVVKNASNSGYVPQGRFLTLYGNRAFDCGSVGFDLGLCWNMTFTGNTAVSCHHHGIEIHGTNIASIVGNEVVDCCRDETLPASSSAGIIVTNSHYFSPFSAVGDIVISGNTVGPSANQKYGILVNQPSPGYSVTGVQITGNNCHGAGTIKDIDSMVVGVTMAGNKTSEMGRSGQELTGTDVRLGGYTPSTATIRLKSSLNPVNHLEVASSDTGGPLVMRAAGTDSNIDMAFLAKNGGVNWLFPEVTIGAVTAKGFTYAKDFSGNLIKVMIAN